MMKNGHGRVSSHSHVVGGPRDTTPAEAFKDIITNFTVCRKDCPFNICRIDQNSKHIWVGKLSQSEIITIITDIISEDNPHQECAKR